MQIEMTETRIVSEDGRGSRQLEQGQQYDVSESAAHELIVPSVKNGFCPRATIVKEAS